MKTKLKKVINLIIDILVALILVVSLLTVVLSLTSKSSGVPNVFGIAPFTVMSSSMEDTFSEGDLIFSKVTVGTDYEYKVGDVVTFPLEVDGIVTYNTHRIVNVNDDEDIIYYETQGDNRKTNPMPDEELQTPDKIVAVWTGTKVPVMGKIMSFIRTQLGFFLCVLLPMIIFFVYEAIRVIMNIVAYNKEKALEEAQAAVQNAELTEEQKKKAIEEYLASIGQKPNEGNEDCVQTPAQDNTSQAEE